MLRTMFAIAVAALIFTGGSATTQAAPILPLPSAATASFNNLTDVQSGRRCCGPNWGRPGSVAWAGLNWGPWVGLRGPVWGTGPGWGGGSGRNCWRDARGRLLCRWWLPLLNVETKPRDTAAVHPGEQCHRFGVLSGYDRCDYVDGVRWLGPPSRIT